MINESTVIALVCALLAMRVLFCINYSCYSEVMLHFFKIINLN